jgi:S1-C subfamily serine protease
MSVGEVRTTQLITTYGVGAVIAAEDETFMVCGLNRWTPGDEVVEPRLVKELGLAADEGVLVLEVRSGGAAERASLKMLDLVLALDGQTVRTVDDVQRIVRQKQPGAAMRVTFLRDGKRREVTVVL